MTRDDKHALFAAAALQAMIAVTEAKPLSERDDPHGVASDAWYYADSMMNEMEKK